MLKLFCYLISAIPEIAMLGYLWIKLKQWKNKYTKYKLNQQQVDNNISNGMRFDYATGIEKNWKHTWNQSHPKEHKWLELAIIAIKAIVLFKILWAILWIVAYAITQ